jgi:hypothetical protein
MAVVDQAAGIDWQGVNFRIDVYETVIATPGNVGAQWTFPFLQPGLNPFPIILNKNIKNLTATTRQRKKEKQRETSWGLGVPMENSRTGSTGSARHVLFPCAMGWTPWHISGQGMVPASGAMAAVCGHGMCDVVGRQGGGARLVLRRRGLWTARLTGRHLYLWWR